MPYSYGQFRTLYGKFSTEGRRRIGELGTWHRHDIRRECRRVIADASTEHTTANAHYAIPRAAYRYRTHSSMPYVSTEQRIAAYPTAVPDSA
eukprot:96928-Rhodomonas_salina.1